MFTSGSILFPVRFRQALWSTYANAGLTEPSTPTPTQQCLCKTAAGGRGQNICMPFFLHPSFPTLSFLSGVFLSFLSLDHLCFLFPFFSRHHLQHVKDELCPYCRFDQSLWVPLRKMLLWQVPLTPNPSVPRMTLDLCWLYHIGGKACVLFGLLLVA